MESLSAEMVPAVATVVKPGLAKVEKVMALAVVLAVTTAVQDPAVVKVLMVSFTLNIKACKHTQLYFVYKNSKFKHTKFSVLF